MEYSIIWSDTAIADLTEIARYIARDNPQAARSYGEEIIDQVDRLSSFPRLGRPYPRRTKGPVHELIYRSHRIFYQVSEEPRRVEVLRIQHTARDIPA